MTAGGRLVSGSFGRLWGKGYERLTPSLRRVLSVSGPGATTFLQGLITSDLLSLPDPPRQEKIVQEGDGGDDDASGSAAAVGEEYRQNVQTIEFGDKLRSTCFLDSRGRMITDGLLWKLNDNQYYIDCPAIVNDDAAAPTETDEGDNDGGGDKNNDNNDDDDDDAPAKEEELSPAEKLLMHLKQYKLRRTKVKIRDCTDDPTSSLHVVFGTLNAAGAPPGYLAAVDPRHPSLGMRVLRLPKDEEGDKENRGNGDRNNEAGDDEFGETMSRIFPHSPGNYELVRRLAGVAEGRETNGSVSLECNHEFLNSISFHKGCYIGQELTARVHHTGAIRKRVVPLFLTDTMTEIPHMWNVADNLQRGRADKIFTKSELKQLPSRLPRLSVYAAGNLVGAFTGSVEMGDGQQQQLDQGEIDRVRQKSEELLRQIQDCCHVGADITDLKEGKTIGRVVSKPVNGTNVVLALMKLDSLGLLRGGVWSKLNKIQIGSDADNNYHTFRYLPYVPLWWPEIHPETGKAVETKADGDDDDDYSHYDGEAHPDIKEPSSDSTQQTVLEIEEVETTTQTKA